MKLPLKSTPRSGRPGDCVGQVAWLLREVGSGSHQAWLGRVPEKPGSLYLAQKDPGLGQGRPGGRKFPDDVRRQGRNSAPSEHLDISVTLAAGTHTPKESWPGPRGKVAGTGDPRGSQAPARGEMKACDWEKDERGGGPCL